MKREEILKKTNEIFKEIFDESIIITEQTSSSEVDGWDSLTHITIISEVEDQFNIKFSMKEILGMKNIGEMIDIIERISK